MADEEPPSYASVVNGTADVPDAPPQTEPEDPPVYSSGLLRPARTENGPYKYCIGSRTLDTPLVHLHHLRAHLALLRAFKDLRSAVEGATRLGIRGMEGTARWAWFVGLAVERFQRWAALVRREDLQTWVAEELPPIDVLMVWHAYLLNPLWYAEDCVRLPIMQTLRALGDRFICAVVEMGDPSQYQPSSERIIAWREHTGTPWYPLEAAVLMSHRTFECPVCHAFNDAPYLTASGTGYAQHKFVWRCTRCAWEVTREMLAVRKFVQDLARPFLDQREPGWGYDGYLAGTLHTQMEAADTLHAKNSKILVLRMGVCRKSSQHLSQSEWEEELLWKLDHSLVQARATVDVALKYRILGRRMSARIFNAYANDRPFSIDLVGAVVRQGSFIDKMHSFGWLQPRYFDEPADELVLLHALARYHAFLDLMRSSPTLFLVPTLDIDLAWHTHQLMGNRYMNECKKYVKRYVDHDDRVEENFLATRFDDTCRAWEQRFNMPYAHCGCPLPGNTIGQRLSSLSHNLFRKANTSTAALTPPPRADALSATHASEHNAVPASARADSRSAGRQEELARRWRRDAQRAAAGRMDAAAFERARVHDAAFLAPVPFYDPVATCVVVANPVSDGAGAAVSWVVSACAVGAGACGVGGASYAATGAVAPSAGNLG